jgi:hypothetical protein
MVPDEMKLSVAAHAMKRVAAYPLAQPGRHSAGARPVRRRAG